jgi:site-specific recombinase XerD
MLRDHSLTPFSRCPNQGARGGERHADVGRDELREFFVWLPDQGYAKGYANTIGRALQQFVKWFAAEEDVPNPFDRIKPPAPPKPDENPKRVIEVEQLAALIRDAEKGRDYESRQDAAILRLFACTGCRLAELAHLQVDDVDVSKREATITGKGSKTRTVRIDQRAALALDRFLRTRAKHRHAHLPALWIGTRRAQAMTPSGIRQIIERRGNASASISTLICSGTRSPTGGSTPAAPRATSWNWLDGTRRRCCTPTAGPPGPPARRAYDRVEVMGGV